MTVSSPCRVLIGALLASLLVACPDDVEYVAIDSSDDTGGGGNDAGGDATVPPGCELVPVVQVNAPQDGVTYSHADGLQVAIEVAHFSIVDRLGEAAADCEGHFHIFIDDVYQGPTAQLEDTYDLSRFEPGPRTFKVSVHNNDHTPYPGIAPVIVEFTTE